MGSYFEQTLKSVEVEVIYPQQLSDSLGKCRFTVKIGSNDNFRKIKKHITESLDTQGKLMYGKYNCDESLLKKMSDCTSGSKEEKFYFTTTRKPRARSSTQQLSITLLLPSQDGVKVREIQIAKTTTISSLKHKIQDDYAIPVEEQTIRAQGQQKELLSATNIMQLKEPIALEVKWTRDVASPPVAKLRAAKTQQQRTNTSLISSGTPYSTKVLPHKRKGSIDISPIHQRTLKQKEKAETEEVQSEANVFVQHVTFETLHQLGKHFEVFTKDRRKSLSVECTHSNEENKVNIRSKVTDSKEKGSAVEDG